VILPEGSCRRGILARMPPGVDHDFGDEHSYDHETSVLGGSWASRRMKRSGFVDQYSAGL